MDEISVAGCGPKMELLRQMAEFYPAMDLGALELITRIQAVAKLHSSLLTKSLGKYDLTEARMYVLSNLILHERMGEPAMTPSAISDRLEITRATVTSLLDGLQETGYIVRSNSEDDRRAILIQITDKARNLLNDILSDGMPRLKSAIGFLSEQERHSMLDWLEKIEINLEKAHSY